MNSSRLFHFSENPDIEIFEPRPVSVPSRRPPGMDWLNGPLVWAIDEHHAFMYLFPRDCPRILVWARSDSTNEDRALWLRGNRVAAYVEEHRLDELRATRVYRYELPSRTFEDLNDAGMWVSRQTVEPIGCTRIADLEAALESYEVELRVVPSLVPLRSVWESSLHASGIRLRNAVGWNTQQQEGHP